MDCAILKTRLDEKGLDVDVFEEVGDPSNRNDGLFPILIIGILFLYTVLYLCCI